MKPFGSGTDSISLYSILNTHLVAVTSNLYKVGQKTAHDFLSNNFTYSQSESVSQFWAQNDA